MEDPQFAFCDSHAHLSSPEVYPHVEAVLTRAWQCQVKTVVNIGTDRASLDNGLLLAKRFPGIYNAAAIPPHYIESDWSETFAHIKEIAEADHLCAIGETGLDYHYGKETKSLQKELLKKHFELALNLAKPVVIHCRDAFEDFFTLLDDYYRQGTKWAPGILHCFTGTLSDAQELLKRGWLLSFSGIVTYKKSTELREVIKQTPLEQLLIETDTPYLAPQSHRGKANEPSFLPEIAAMVALTKGVDLGTVAQKTSENTRKIFALD